MEEKVSSLFFRKERLHRYLVLTFSLLLTAIVYNLFLRPSHFIAGGTNGVSLLLEYIFGFPSGITLFILYLSLLFISLHYLGKEETMASVFITIVYPFFVSITRRICAMISLGSSSLLLIAIFAGILLGVSNGLIYKMGFNTGGIGVISKIISKKRSASLPIVNFLVNVWIVLVGAFVLGIDCVLYSIVLLFVCQFVSNKILLGVSTNKMYFIISEKNDEILHFLNDELKRDATVHKVKGKYTNKKKMMIVTVLPNREYFMVKETVKLLDSHAFLFSCDSYELKGQDQKIRNVIS